MDYKNLIDLLTKLENNASGSFLFSSNNRYSISRDLAISYVERIAIGLLKHGVQKGDRIVILSENRPEWILSDMGIMSCGAITVPAYTTYTEDDLLHVLNNSGAKAIFLSENFLGKEDIISAINRSGSCKKVIYFTRQDFFKENENNLSLPLSESSLEQSISFKEARITSLADLIGNTEDKNLYDKLESVVANIEGKDIACIIYTSGTGGKPKGVMLSHSSIIHNCLGANELLSKIINKKKQEVFLSWLPLSHSYEHTIQFYAVSIGAQIHYAESVDKLLKNLSEVKPTIMTAVPRFFETICSKIKTNINTQSKVSAFLINKAITLGEKEYSSMGNLSLTEQFLNQFLSVIVRKKIKKRFGGNLKALVSGGAALNYDVGIFLHSLGLPILQGYGQTEAGPVISANPPEKVKLDTVGLPLKGVDVKIAEDGEILVRGDNVMSGYWMEEKLTKKTIVDSWLHTGDIGLIDDDGYLKITDRKKDIIVNSGGDNISPSKIEGLLTLDDKIAQAMVYGDKKSHLVALVVPEGEFLTSWIKSHNLSADHEKIIESNKDFKKIFDNIIAKINNRLSTIEKVRSIYLIDEPFSIDNGLLTPTLKNKRYKIIENYRGILESLYARK